MRTEVCITVDTEFSIGGAFADPERNRPVGEQMVRCQVGEISHGLGFLLRTFEEHGIRATFFVETLQTEYFGDEPMRTVVQEILEAGHDVEMHIHPCWKIFSDPDWGDVVRAQPPDDSMAGRSVEEVEEFIVLGMESLERWGAPRPVALRTGGLRVDRSVYDAMERQDLSVGSNVGLAIFRPEEPELQFNVGVHRVGKIIEAPVLTYRDIGVGLRGRTPTR